MTISARTRKHVHPSRRSHHSSGACHDRTPFPAPFSRLRLPAAHRGRRPDRKSHIRRDGNAAGIFRQGDPAGKDPFRLQLWRGRQGGQRRLHEHLPHPHAQGRPACGVHVAALYAHQGIAGRRGHGRREQGRGNRQIHRSVRGQRRQGRVQPADQARRHPLQRGQVLHPGPGVLQGAAPERRQGHGGRAARLQQGHAAIRQGLRRGPLFAQPRAPGKPQAPGRGRLFRFVHGHGRHSRRRGPGRLFPDRRAGQRRGRLHPSRRPLHRQPRTPQGHGRHRRHGRPARGKHPLHAHRADASRPRPRPHDQGRGPHGVHPPGHPRRQRRHGLVPHPAGGALRQFERHHRQGGPVRARRQIHRRRDRR
ncbi:hypothetical protein DSECCO2_458620 [anaerobic digester metagenome]